MFLGFFNEVEIRSHELLHPSFFDPLSKTWMWQHEKKLFPYEVNSEILFKVKGVSIGEDSSAGEKRIAINRTSKAANVSAVSSISPNVSDHPMAETGGGRSQPPMLVIGTVQESGLGPCLWWGLSPS